MLNLILPKVYHSEVKTSSVLLLSEATLVLQVPLCPSPPDPTPQLSKNSQDKQHSEKCPWLLSSDRLQEGSCSPANQYSRHQRGFHHLYSSNITCALILWYPKLPSLPWVSIASPGEEGQMFQVFTSSSSCFSNSTQHPCTAAVSWHCFSLMFLSIHLILKINKWKKALLAEPEPQTAHITDRSLLWDSSPPELQHTLTCLHHHHSAFPVVHPHKG